MLIRNVRGYALEIAATGQFVEPGATVEVSDQLADSLLDQPANWVSESTGERPAESASKAKWVAYAVFGGMDEADAKALTKAELIDLPAAQPDLEDLPPADDLPTTGAPEAADGETSPDDDDTTTTDDAASSGEEA